MSEYSGFAISVLSRAEYNFGEYRAVAARSAQLCLMLSDECDEKLRKVEVSSQRSYVLALALKAATEFCINKKIDADSETCTDIFFTDVYDFITDLTYALTDYDYWMNNHDETELKKSFNLRLPIYDGGRLEYYLVDQDVHHQSKEIEKITASYLSSKVRSDELDSFMFKVLAEEEPIQFIYDVAHQFPGISDFPRPRLEVAKENINALETPILKAALKGFFRYFMFSLIIFGLAFLAEFALFKGDDWPFLIAFALSVITMGVWLSLFVWFVSAKIKFMRNRNENGDVRLLKLVDNMSSFFRMMRSPGKLSLDRIEKKLSDLEGFGAVMPETLHVFIKDLRERGKHSI